MPWWPIAITALVLITAAFATDPVRDAVTLGPVSEARLEQTPGYLALGPISSILDTLTLLTVGQHIAILLTAMIMYAAFRVLKSQRQATTLIRELGFGSLCLTGFVFVYAAGAVLPRPMAHLTTSDPLVIALDFHSHTKYSHDGRAGWSEEDLRDWEQRAGVDAAYVTDHRTFEGAERGMAGNPAQAGQGTMLLQGLEAFYKGEHVNVLSAGRRFRGIASKDLKDIDEEAFRMASLIVPTSPIAIETLPGNLSKVPAETDSTAGVAAIEIVDGSPRGLTQTRRERAKIVRIADSLNLALVTGSDNHGWGQAAPAWTLMRIPGWRGMSGDSLARVIEDYLRAGRRGATRPIERTIASGNSPIAIIFSAPLVVWRMFTTLGPDERVMWLLWTWAIVLLVRWRSRS